MYLDPSASLRLVGCLVSSDKPLLLWPGARGSERSGAVRPWRAQATRLMVLHVDEEHGNAHVPECLANRIQRGETLCSTSCGRKRAGVLLSYADVHFEPSSHSNGGRANAYRPLAAGKKLAQSCFRDGCSWGNFRHSSPRPQGKLQGI
ncbi:hypothetical protein [Rhizobacter sp. SG703]|uniref:hypothetical protein n=1 Tax=Rhizobacter sp. SG703 TaxID=2587140 RepID=UPI00144716DC|nr:hypothetical protein [Rhizobacter sp. SG703]NKI93907.1 hypothetical protein [Rhizobacter sp. SG703]